VGGGVDEFILWLTSLEAEIRLLSIPNHFEEFEINFFKVFFVAFVCVSQSHIVMAPHIAGIFF
jgi:hypothetical protein